MLMNVLLSGLIAAIISGLINFYGNWRATKTQKEIAKMQKDERLFYESQLDWMNETRKLIAKFVSDCFRFNVVINDINALHRKVDSKNFGFDDTASLLKNSSENTSKAANLISVLNEEVTMIRLYLFHSNDKYEEALLRMVRLIEHNMDVNNGINGRLLDEFVDVARNYFDHQMEELKEKSA
ncbi:hypothetical protein FC35_GL000794 [Limosilactobacillus coleohominis DSM 14060]|nr:hypothetical protein FC35_GL000794 [Limosilactobacillus coleohominis DSM 14060]